jgi:hypothetical protein
MAVQAVVEEVPHEAGVKKLIVCRLNAALLRPSCCLNK